MLNDFQIFRSAISGDYKGNKIALSDEVKTIIEEFTKQVDIELPDEL